MSEPIQKLTKKDILTNEYNKAFKEVTNAEIDIAILLEMKPNDIVGYQNKMVGGQQVQVGINVAHTIADRKNDLSGYQNRLDTVNKMLEDSK